MPRSESQKSKIAKSRRQASLGSKLEKNLWAYTAVAGAAGVGLLAMASQANAEVVYTATNQQIPHSTVFPLDLNGDGTVDFNIVNWPAAGNSNAYSYMAVCHTKAKEIGPWACISSSSQLAPNAANEVRVIKEGAADLAAGVKIGPGAQWGGQGQAVMMGSRIIASTSNQDLRWERPWANDGKGVTNRYLGFKFKIGSEFHYGWARLTVKTSTVREDAFTVTLTGYAYETIPGKAITAGATTGAVSASAVEPASSTTKQQASLGLLSLGATGLSIWRKEESQNSNVIAEN